MSVHRSDSRIEELRWWYLPGVSMWEPIQVPLLGIAPSVPPDTRCGAAATVHERGRSTAKRRPECRRLPLLFIASPAASPARRTCGPFSRAGAAPAKGLPSGRASCAPLTGAPRRGRLEQVARVWGRRPRWTAGRGGGRRAFGGAACGTQACAGRRRCEGGIVPAQVGIRRSFSPVLCRIDHAPSGDTRRRAADDRSSRPENCAG